MSHETSQAELVPNSYTVRESREILFSTCSQMMAIKLATTERFSSTVELTLPCKGGRFRPKTPDCRFFAVFGGPHVGPRGGRVPALFQALNAPEQLTQLAADCVGPHPLALLVSLRPTLRASAFEQPWRSGERVRGRASSVRREGGRRP